VLDRLADELIEHETLDTPELMQILEPLPTWNGTGRAADAKPKPARKRSVKPEREAGPVKARTRRTPPRPATA